MRWPLVGCVAFFACSGRDLEGRVIQPTLPAVGSPRWAIALGGGGTDLASGAAIDSSGNVLVGVGSLGPSSLVTKRAAADGSEVWTIKFAATVPNAAVDLAGFAVAGDDSVLVTGDYAGTIDFGGQTLTFDVTPATIGDMFLAKYTPNGDLVWVTGLSSTANARGLRIATDDRGRIFVAGMFDGPLDLAGHAFSPTNGNSDCFIAAFDAAGHLLGGSVILGTGTNTRVTPTSAAVTVAGDVLLTGSFSGQVTLGTVELSPEAADRAFLAHFDNNAQPRSIQAVGAAAPGESFPTQVATSFAGSFVQTIESDTAGTPTAYGRVYAFDDNGSPTWSARVDDAGSTNPQLRTLAVSPDGSAVSAAWVDAPYNADHPETTTGNMELANFDASGTRATSSFGRRMVGAPPATTVRGSVFGLDGTSAFVGDFAGVLDFGGGPMVSGSNADTDVFVVLVDPAGAL
jgi:hypothetical protein